MTRSNVALFQRHNEFKANFDDIYVQSTPMDYYRVLYGLDYVIPDLAKGVFRGLAAALAKTKSQPPKILDVGCSYGVNAALLKHPLDIDRLAQRFRDLESAGLEPDEAISLDRAYFQSWPNAGMEIVGLDVSRPAVDYACRVGLIDSGIVANLETSDLRPEDAAQLGGVDLVISTGCVGYVGPATFGRLLDAFGDRRPWIASFVLRMFDFSEIEALFERRGLVTERLKGVTFVQRRFHSLREYSSTLETLRARGVDPAGKEEEGLLHADFFLSRPREDVEAAPLETMACVTSGANRSFGRRFSARGDHAVRFGR